MCRCASIYRDLRYESVTGASSKTFHAALTYPSLNILITFIPVARPIIVRSLQLSHDETAPLFPFHLSHERAADQTSHQTASRTEPETL